MAAAPGPETVKAPNGIWRVGWASDPLYAPSPTAMDLADSEAGNRFDSLTGDFDTAYYGTTVEACYCETLAPRRPKPELADLVRESGEWVHYMEPGRVEAGWRRARVLVQVAEDPTAEFVDVTHQRTIAWLNLELKPALAALGLGRITVAKLVGRRRLITRLISSYVHSLEDEQGRPLFAGIRYESQYGANLECWAVYEHFIVTEIDRRIIDQADPALQQTAKLLGLEIV